MRLFGVSRRMLACLATLLALLLSLAPPASARPLLYSSIDNVVSDMGNTQVCLTSSC